MNDKNDFGWINTIQHKHTEKNSVWDAAYEIYVSHKNTEAREPDFQQILADVICHTILSNSISRRSIKLNYRIIIYICKNVKFIDGEPIPGNGLFDDIEKYCGHLICPVCSKYGINDKHSEQNCKDHIIKLVMEQ